MVNIGHGLAGELVRRERATVFGNNTANKFAG